MIGGGVGHGVVVECVVVGMVLLAVGFVVRVW